MDFTLNKYQELINAILKQEYCFQTVQQYFESPIAKSIILRHDVDKRPAHSLKFAQIQHQLSIKGTYYFRCLPMSFDAKIIKEIADMGHEIGYHYENLSFIAQQKNIKNKDQLYSLAWDDFRTQLDRFRKLYPVKTICMHGAPLSKYDNKSLWEKFDYRSEGIIAEPYLDIDFLQDSYYTDTGRRWDGEQYSLRDSVHINQEKARSTNDLIHLFDSKLLKDHILLTFHPQRWTNDPIIWLREYFLQSIKNEMKKMLKMLRNNNV